MSAAAAERSGDPVRIVRVIARLNIGGPAIQAITLTRRLDQYGYATTLIRGTEEPDEGRMDYLAEELEVHPVLIPSLRRNPGWHDLRALWALIGIIRRERPGIVHTHAAKGGTLGRMATVIAFPLRHRRPVLIHTYHGHSLTGYFSDPTAAMYRRIEQVLGRFTDRLIAVSEEVRDELVALGVSPAPKFVVVPLGFDLSPFMVDGLVRQQARRAVRAELGIAINARVVTLIARLVPIKRVDRFLRLARSLQDIPGTRFLIVGDGELRESLQSSAEARGLGDRLVWAGFRRDMPSVCFASDVVVQTSDNEGTPVSLIEAQAAGVPVVSTRVGGSASVVPAEQLVEASDADGLTSVTRELVLDQARAGQTGSVAAVTMRERFGLSRLVLDLDRVYRRELTDRHHPSLRGTNSS